jgi:hypothetical protein
VFRVGTQVRVSLNFLKYTSLQVLAVGAGLRSVGLSAVGSRERLQYGVEQTKFVLCRLRNRGRAGRVQTPLPPTTREPMMESGAVPLSTHSTDSGIADSQHQGNVAAAKFLLSQLLEQKPYHALNLTEAQCDNLVRSAIGIPSPEAELNVDAIKRFLVESLKELKRVIKSPIRTAPKQGRLRRTLDYDHKKRIAPSRAIEHPLPLSQISSVKAYCCNLVQLGTLGKI